MRTLTFCRWMIRVTIILKSTLQYLLKLILYMLYDPVISLGLYLREITAEFHKWTCSKDGYGGSIHPGELLKATLEILY